jgi:hypothetical protein
MIDEVERCKTTTSLSKESQHFVAHSPDYPTMVFAMDEAAVEATSGLRKSIFSRWPGILPQRKAHTCA